MERIIVICGPTAVGKTGVGLQLCREFNGEIISADSQQVYRTMDIGTAKDDIAGSDIPCHLIDIIEPDQIFNASEYKELADKAIKDVVSRGKVPFVVGGTGLYVKVLLEGLCDAPERDEGIREELNSLCQHLDEEMASASGLPPKDGHGAPRTAILYDILKKEDSLAASKLHPNDTSRIIRAIEVKRLTGKSIYELHNKNNPPQRYDAIKVGLNIERALLYERINKRVDIMVERGLVEEVKGIVDKYGYDIQSLKAVGYKEIVSYLKGEFSLEKAIELTKRNSRRFAKRQMTWFKRDKEIKWFEPKVEEVHLYIRTFDRNDIFANCNTV